MWPTYTDLMTVNDIVIEGLPAVISVPESGSGPGVIVIQEWWGVVPHIRDVVSRLAQAGYVALAIDHYRGVETTEPDEAQKLMLALNIGEVSHDLAQAAAWLVKQDSVSGDQVGTIGFCMGGGLALLAPTVSESIVAAVAFYPAMPWQDYAPDWSRYVGRAALVNAAEGDHSWAGPKISEYAAAIHAAGGQVTIAEYPESVHAFFNDARPEVYQATNAQAAWAATLQFLDAQLS